MKRIWTRWLPAAAVPAVVAIAALAGGAVAVSPPPPATAEQVLALVASHTTRQFSGTLEERADLGLPSIPSQALGPATASSSLGSAASLLELLTTAHTARVYADGPTKFRLQVIDQLAERDAIRNGNDFWTFDSKSNAVTHTTLPAGEKTPDGAAPTAPNGSALTPDALAQRFLAAADPSTSVTLGNPKSVAGHSAYVLVLTPKSSGTLVGSVQIAVEASTGMPLAVDVYAKGQADPAFHAAFTQLDLAAPDPSVFAFAPPPGATVTQKPLPTPPAGEPGASSSPKPTAAPTPKPTTGPAAMSGKGWDAVVVIPAAKVPAGFIDQPIVKQLAAPVPAGRLLSSSLVNILITNDGRVLVGAVPASTLIAAAAH
ncbi:DUF2092 domain-containing protein [Sinomonas sp. JGH33]|uniref:DUF2092 domain-containing protein n=1 Tax=Sinomonas terricola TaxID=3110330 RepID=A0ABU5T511_9MICC|nr:hypothetical protein [Sinomonas sp. JGH33]MEA5454571.1 DUF2092 domain-containing protein [Sinomonas sp. JGH33]